jgi:hypothetical protein
MSTPLRQRPVWKALEKHHGEIARLHLRDLFAADPKRAERFAAFAAGLHLDYSKNRITDETKLLIADVDGTLVTPDKSLTARACAAVARLRAVGVRFTITSGRPPRGMAMLTGPLRLEDPIAAFNGGMFVRPDLTTVLKEHTLALDVAREVVDILLSAGLDAWVYRGAEWFIRQIEAPHVAREQATCSSHRT